MPRTRESARRAAPAILVAGTLTIVAVTLALVAATGAAGQSATARAVQAVVQDALAAEHELANLPAAAAESGVSASLRGQMTAAAQSAIDRLYVGPIKAAREETIVGGLKVEGTSDGVFVWDGGVHDVSFRSTTIEGTKATVVVQATSYLEVSVTRDGERALPESTAIHTFTLELQDGQWYVSDEEIEFLPGEGP